MKYVMSTLPERLDLPTLRSTSPELHRLIQVVLMPTYIIRHHEPFLPVALLHQPLLAYPYPPQWKANSDMTAWTWANIVLIDNGLLIASSRGHADQDCAKRLAEGGF